MRLQYCYPMLQNVTFFECNILYRVLMIIIVPKPLSAALDRQKREAATPHRRANAGRFGSPLEWRLRMAAPMRTRHHPLVQRRHDLRICQPFEAPHAGTCRRAAQRIRANIQMCPYRKFAGF